MPGAVNLREDFSAAGFGLWPSGRGTPIRAGGCCRWRRSGTGWTEEEQPRSAPWIAGHCVTGFTALTRQDRTACWTIGRAVRRRVFLRSIGPVRPDRRGGSGSREGRGRAVASARPQARHRREVRCRLSSALCRKAAAETRLLPHQCAAPSSSSRRADRRGFQKNFPRALKAHLDGLPETTPIEIWFEDVPRQARDEGPHRPEKRPGSAMGQARNAAKAACRPAL